jgi:hypothetical protein
LKATTNCPMSYAKHDKDIIKRPKTP